MHEPWPTFRDRRSWGWWEVLQGPEEVPLMPGTATEVPGRAEMGTEVPGTATELAWRCLMATAWDATEPPLVSITRGG